MYVNFPYCLMFLKTSTEENSDFRPHGCNCDHLKMLTIFSAGYLLYLHLVLFIFCPKVTTRGRKNTRDARYVVY